MNWLYLLSAVAIGAAFATQPAINGAAIRALGSPISAAALSVFISLISLVVLMPLMGARVSPSAITTLPWWVFLGGLIGALVVAGSATIAPVTGAAVFIVCLIAGQLAGSALVDHFGAFGMEVRPINLMKAGGLALVLAGVLMVRAA